MTRRHATVIAAFAILLSATGATPQTVNPYPRTTISRTTAAEWTFDDSTSGWRASHDCRVEQGSGSLRITCAGTDPYIHGPAVKIPARVIVTMRVKSGGGGGGQWFWLADDEIHTAEERSRRFPMDHDGRWHEYAVELPLGGTLKRLRLDPGSSPGVVEIDWLRIERIVDHPLELERAEVHEKSVVTWVVNHSDRAVTLSVGEDRHRVEPRSRLRFSTPRAEEPGRPFEVVTARVAPEGFPALSRPAAVFNPSAPGEWVSLKDGAALLEVASDGSGAKLVRGAKTVAVIAPLVWSDGRIPPLRVKREGGRIVLTGGAVDLLELALDGGQVSYRLRASRPFEGPVVRALGGLEQGLLAGVEHLGRGERSSSDIDIKGPEHVRFSPKPVELTMQLMAFVTDVGSVAMTWHDPALRPSFATPNFFDGADDHRMALRGRQIDATIRLGRSFEDGERIEDAILWAVRRRGGFPPVPTRPRRPEGQVRLSLTALRTSVVTDVEGGWYHAVVPNHRRMPEKPKYFADHVSTLFHLTGHVPEVPNLSHGGAHIRDDGAYLLTGRAREWINMIDARARGIFGAQRPDGSFRYDGKFVRGHHENTSSGLCAQRATVLLDHARYTGNEESLAAGLKTLDYMKRFRTPRGAQTWECPLHAPDLLASAYLVRSYVRGYELTGKKTHLELAVRWALSGVPYVYQWSNRPIMAYATTPTLCATNWRAPVWIGLPVQWVGLVYADALVDLSVHDRTLDWPRLARGILIAGEQMQYPEGSSVGCLPDVFELTRQERRPADINPCALVALRLRLEGEHQGLGVATSGRHRVVAPFPVKVRDGQAHVEAKEGLRYQVVVDGSRIVEVHSQGRDVVELE